MGELHADIEWDDGSIHQVDIQQDKQKWVDAVQIPVRVVVGLNDTAELPQALIPGQKGNNPTIIARNWIQNMTTFAETNGVESQFELALIPGIGHSMIGLVPYCQDSLVSR